jgi:ATP-dependent helicase/nuclease subunit B
MLTFLEETLTDLKKEYKDLSSLTLILPSKRAGGFLKNYLRETATKTSFAPKIISIEEFIEDLSALKIIDPTELLFKSYETYLRTNSIQKKEDFEKYTSWATTLLADFNEIDRFLLDPKPFFNYLSSIQDINHWYVSNQKTPLIEAYLIFWNSLHLFYENLKLTLLNENLGYQGMVYRKAAEDIEHYCNYNRDKKHVFIGFNALNNAEQHIIQELLETQNTKIYWDVDAHFYNDTKHSSSLFIRRYVREWKYFQTHPPQCFGNHFEKEKKIQFVEVQKNIGQAKYVGELLSTYKEEELNKTAIVLADEKLLIPLLNSLPKNISAVNITMGVPLKTFPATAFFELLLALHLYPSDTLYYKDVLAILNHPLAPSLISENHIILEGIRNQNLSHLSLETLCGLSKGQNKQILALLFGNWQNNSQTALNACLSVLIQLRGTLSEKPIDLAVLHQLHEGFLKIEALNNSFSHLKSIKTVQSLFIEHTETATLDFKGDAYNGLQIMGILETRVLDFENVIITSVNEGVLPAGKSNASFLTYDLKKQFGLPQFTEKDAIYTYHFYHLLHRSNNITLLYNNYSNGINAGEKSRFLLQLEIEKHPNHTIEKIVLAPPIEIEQKKLKSIIKTKEVMARLKEIAEKGFSPSSLTSYIRNPLDFYFQKIVKINEFEEVEETVAANTLGTIVHDTLEAFYKPLENTLLSSKLLLDMKQRIEEEVTKQFIKTFKGGTYNKGKNLIIFEVAKRYISNFINYELSEINAGNKIKIVQIETKLEVTIPISELDFLVKIGGKVDRVDEYNGQIRIIDYKTGKVEQSNLEIVDWEEITLDYKYSKVMQVLAYAVMINKGMPIIKAEAGIISFKNLTSGFLKFSTKEKLGSRTKNQEVTQETLSLYKVELEKLILEICNPNIPFIEKEINNDY